MNRQYCKIWPFVFLYVVIRGLQPVLSDTQSAGSAVTEKVNPGLVKSFY